MRHPSSDYELSKENYAPPTKSQSEWCSFENSTIYNLSAPKSKPIHKTKQGPFRQKANYARFGYWNREQNLQYFYGVVKISLKNPHQSVSWGQWKKNRFYIELSEHFSEIFGEAGGKTQKQCKTKDQNLKKKYYMTPAEENRKDLLELSCDKLRSEVNMLKEKDILDLSESNRLARYQGVLSKISTQKQCKPLLPKYQEHLEELIANLMKSGAELEHLLTSLE